MTLQILQETLTDLEEGKQLSSVSKDWLVSGFRRFLTNGHLEKDLGIAIDLRPGQAYLKPISIERYGRRNAIIQEIAATLPGSTWEKAKKLEVLVRRYPVTSDYRLDQLFNCGVVVPMSARQIQRILKGESVTDRLS